MSVTKGLNRRHLPVESLDERLILAPFSFKVDGDGDIVAGSLDGDYFASGTHDATGRYTLTLKRRPARSFGGAASTTDVATPVDGAQVNDANTVSAGTVEVRTRTDGTLANPAANAFVKGHVVLSGTTRSSRKR